MGQDKLLMVIWQNYVSCFYKNRFEAPREARLAKKREIPIFPMTVGNMTVGNTGNSREILGILEKYWDFSRNTGIFWEIP